MCSIVAQVQIFSVWPASSKVGSLSLLWKSLMAATMTKIQLQPEAGFQLIEIVMSGLTNRLGQSDMDWSFSCKAS